MLGKVLFLFVSYCLLFVIIYFFLGALNPSPKRGAPSRHFTPLHKGRGKPRERGAGEGLFIA